MGGIQSRSYCLELLQNGAQPIGFSNMTKRSACELFQR